MLSIAIEFDDVVYFFHGNSIPTLIEISSQYMAVIQRTLIANVFPKAMLKASVVIRSVSNTCSRFI